MSGAYSQSGPKRQKVREGRLGEVDYFHGIDKVEFSSASSDGNTYRYYNNTERLNGRSMEEWLKYSVSLTEFRSNGSDNHGRPTFNRSWDDHSNSLENYKKSIKACFDFCCKLGVKYWTAFDTDLVPNVDSFEENKSNWDEVVDFIIDCVQKTHVKPLWIAPDLHSHPRYASGAITSNDATTFMHAAAQIKKCIEVSQKLNCESFLIWPYREGYSAIFKSDIAREMKIFAKLLKMSFDYKERLNYRCQMLIMPYYNDYNYDNSRNWRNYDRINRYMWDVTSCLYFLKYNNLERFFKVCVPPGHHMYMASIYNMLGGVVINDDWEQYEARRMTLMMKSIVDQGTCPQSGLNLRLSPKRDSTDAKDLLYAYIRCIDSAAKALRVACAVNSDQIFSKHLQQRYASYSAGCGSRLGGELGLDDCDDYCKKHPTQSNDPIPSSRSEHLDIILQRYMDSCDQI